MRKKPSPAPKPRANSRARSKSAAPITVSQMMPSVKARLADIQGQQGGSGASSIFTGSGARAMQNMGASFGLTAMSKSHKALPIGQDNNFFMYPTSNAGVPTSPGGMSVRGSKQSNQRRGLEIEAANVSMVQPAFHTPGNAQDAYNLPKSYVEQIRWSRLMYNLNAYIGAITDLKSYYAYSKFDLATPEPFVTEFYTGVSFTKNFNLYKHVLRKSLSKNKFGEAISWGSRGQDGVWPKTGKPRWIWENFILLEPELVEIKKQLIGSGQPQFFLRPSRDLQEMVEKIDSNDREAAEYKGKLGEPIMEKIRRKELVPIDPSTISAIQNLTDASAVRGTPPYQRLFVTFIYEDFIRLSQMAQAQRYHFPVELWTLGDLEKGILPNPADLQNLRDLVTQAIQTPPFAIFFPPILKYEALGVSGKLLTIKSDYEYIWQQYTVGMGVSENMILGESGIFSSTETSSNQAFIRAQKKDRDEMEEWMRWQFYEPLARWNNLKVKKGDQLVPILPDIMWEKTLDFAAEERDLKAAQTLWDKGVYPTKRLLSKNRENPDEIEQELKEEIGSVFDDGKRIAAPAIREAGEKAKAGPGGPGMGGPDTGGADVGAEEAGGGGGAGGAGAPPASAGVDEGAAAAPEAGAAPEGGAPGEAAGGAGEAPVGPPGEGVL